jgi:hypothetical protein
MVILKVKISDVWKDLEVNQNTPFPIEFQLADIRNISKRNLSFSKTIELPTSKVNNEVFDMLFDVAASSIIDVRKNIPCRVLSDESEIFNGNIIINQIVTTDNKRYRYNCQLVNSLSNIISKLDNLLIGDIGLESLNHEVNFTNVFDSWEKDLPYFYPLIDYNNGWSSGDLKDLGIRSTDMKPAVRLDYIWNKMFQSTNTSYDSDSIQNGGIFDRVILPTTSKEIKISQNFIRENTFRVGLSQIWAPNPSGVNLYYNNSQPSFRFSELVGNIIDGVFVPTYVPFDNEDNAVGNFDFGGLFDSNNRSYVNVKTTKVNQRFCLKLDIKVFNRLQHKAKGGDIYVRFWRGTDPITGNNTPTPIEISDYKNNDINYPFTTGPGKKSVFITKPSKAYRDPNLVYFDSITNEPLNGYFAASPFNKPGFSSFGIAGSQSIIETKDDEYNGFKRYNFFINTVFLDGTTPERKPIQTGERVWVEINTGYSSAFYISQVKPDFENSGLVPFELMPESYFFNEISDRNLDSSYDIDMTSIFPKNIKSLDIFNNIIKMYNLYIDVNQRDPNLLIVETRDKFYTGEFLDWSQKLDISQPVIQDPLVQKWSNVRLTHKEDKDLYNTDYKDNYNKLYGEYNFITGNEYTNEEQLIETTFSPTPVFANDNLRSVVYPVILTEGASSNRNEFVGSNMRILQHSPIKLEPTLGNDYIKIDGVTFSYYPYAGHFDKPLEGNSDLNFGMPDKIYFDLNKINNNNLFELYWRKMLEELTDKDSRLVTAYFYLTPEDIYDFSFRKLIKVDSLSSDTINYFKVNKIEYDATRRGSYKVELIKARDFNLVDDCFCYAVDNVPFSGGSSFSVNIGGVWVDKTNELAPTPAATGISWIWRGRSCEEIKQWKIDSDFAFEVEGTQSNTFGPIGLMLNYTNIFPSEYEEVEDTYLSWNFRNDSYIVNKLNNKSSYVWTPPFTGTFNFEWEVDWSVNVTWNRFIADSGNIWNGVQFKASIVSSTSSSDVFLSPTTYLAPGSNTESNTFTFSVTITETDINLGKVLVLRNFLYTRATNPPYSPTIDLTKGRLRIVDYDGSVIKKYGAIEQTKCKPTLNVGKIVRKDERSATTINTGIFNTNSSNNTIITGNQNTIGDSSEGSTIVGNNITIINSTATVIQSNTSNVYNSSQSTIISSNNVTINESIYSLIQNSYQTTINGSTNSVVIGSNLTNLFNTENVVVIGGDNTTINNQSDVIILGKSTIQEVDIISAGIDEVLGKFPTAVPFNLVSGSIDDIRNLGSHTIISLISAIR